MPASKVISIGRSGLEKVLRYLTNAGTESHQEYRLTPLRCLATPGPEDFLRLAEEGLRANRQRRLMGREPENIGYWYIVRFPDGAKLTEVERRYCWRRIIEEADVGSHVGAVANEHINRIFDSQDFNLIKPAFDLIGLPTRESGAHPIFSLREQMDGAADRINDHRRKAGSSNLLTEMRLIRSTRMQQRGVDLVGSLARLPKLVMTADDLLPALWSLGWEARLTGPRKAQVEITDESAKWKRELAADRLLQLVILERVRLLATRNRKKPDKTKTSVADISLSESPDGYL